MSILEISVPEFDGRAGKEDSLFQDLHVVFKVVTRLSGGGESSESKSTWRRYREFDLLRGYFIATYPEIVMPPIPQKKMNFTWESMGLDPFQTSFLEERMAGLEVFLERVSVQPQLQADEIFRIFLTEDTTFMEKANATKFAEKADSRLKSEIASLRIKKIDARFSGTMQYAEQFGQCCREARADSKKLCTIQAAISGHHRQLGKSFSGWASDEADIPEQLAATGRQLASQAESTLGCLNAIEQKFGQPMQEYCLYDTPLKSVARHQLLMQYGLEQTEEALSNKAIAKTEVGAEREDQITLGRIAARVLAGETTKSARLHGIQREIDSLERLSQRQLQELNTFTASAIKELDVFNSQKSADLRAYWKEFVQQQITINTKAIQTWKNVRASFADVKSS